MICDHLDDAPRYAGLGEDFAMAFAYLRRAAAGDFVMGKTVLAPDRVWASVVRKVGRPAAGAGFEVHRQFADIHLCLSGQERLGWCEGSNGLSLRCEFKQDEDFALYHGTPQDFLTLRNGRFAIFFPGELHAPLIGDAEMVKVCVKVRCESTS